MKIAKWWNVRLPFGKVNIHAMNSRSVRSMTAKTAHSQLEPLVLMVMSELVGFTLRASFAMVKVLVWFVRQWGVEGEAKPSKERSSRQVYMSPMDSYQLA